MFHDVLTKRHSGWSQLSRHKSKAQLDVISTADACIYASLYRCVAGVASHSIYYGTKMQLPVIKYTISATVGVEQDTNATQQPGALGRRIPLGKACLLMSEHAA